MSLLSGHHEPFLFKGPNGVLHTQPQQGPNKKHKEMLGYVLPRATPSVSILDSDNTIMFDLNGEVDQVEHMYMKFTITNNNGSGNSLELVDVFTMLDYAEVRFDNEAVQTIYGDALRKEMMLMTPNERLTVFDSYWGLSPTYNADGTIADGASRTFRLPLMTMLSSCKVPLWREEYSIRIVVHLRGGNDVVESTSTAAFSDIAFSDCELRLDGLVFAEDVKIAINRTLDNSGTVGYKYIDHVKEPIPAGSVTDGVVKSVNVHSTGPVAMIWLDLRASTATGEDLYNPADIDTVEALQNGKVVSHNLMEGAFHYSDIEYASSLHWENPKYVAYKNAAYISFCDRPAAAIAQGAHSGYFKFTSKSERIRFTPGATIADAVLTAYHCIYSTTRVNYGSGQKSIDRTPTEF